MRIAVSASKVHECISLVGRGQGGNEKRREEDENGEKKEQTLRCHVQTSVGCLWEESVGKKGE